MQLAGIPIRDEDVSKLAWLLRTGGPEDVADKLIEALLVETKVLTLTITDRESILRALEDCPDGLGRTASRSLNEHE